MIILQKNNEKKYNLELKSICSKLLLNLLYKSNNAIAIFNKEEVKDELKFSLREIEN